MVADRDRGDHGMQRSAALLRDVRLTPLLETKWVEGVLRMAVLQLTREG